jgi:tetratricopeptide (TPR) repeat protein
MSSLLFLSLFQNFPTDQDIAPRAYEKMGDFDKAIEAYQKLVDFDPKGRDRRWHIPVYHYRLGRLCEAKGLKDRAAAEYRRFLDLWKDGDPDIPELLDAKKRMGITP